jgi:hypothetical protein
MKKQYMNYMKSCLLVMIACLVSMVGAAQGFSRRYGTIENKTTMVSFTECCRYAIR